MKKSCRAIKKNGEPCKTPVLTGSDFCLFHQTGEKKSEFIKRKPLENREKLCIAKDQIKKLRAMEPSLQVTKELRSWLFYIQVLERKSSEIPEEEEALDYKEKIEKWKDEQPQ